MIVPFFLGAGISEGAAQPQDLSGTSFRAETEGLPVSTVVGVWAETAQGREVDLRVVGGRAVGGRTVFVATWNSPWTQRPKPRLEGAYEVERLDSVGSPMRFRWRLRYQLRGDSWGQWHSYRFRVRPDSSVGITFQYDAAAPGSARFEWQMRAHVPPGALIAADASLAAQ